MRLFVKRGDAGGLSRACFAAVLACFFLLAGCDQVFQDQSKRSLDKAEKKYAEGDFRGAVQSYEAALDGTAKTAEIHYKLALTYDDKLKNPLGALYHFQRYLELNPSGPRAKDTRNFIKEDELKLATTLSHGALMSQEDAARLKNDNLVLRKQITELRAAPKQPASKVGAQPTNAAMKLPPGSRTYVVRHGDTLASISRKFFKTSARWKDIEDANFNALNGTVKLKPGMTLIIPK